MPSPNKPLKTIFIEPTYSIYYGDQIFNPMAYQDPSMAMPMIKLREELGARGIEIHTVDYFEKGLHHGNENEYWSFGAVNFLPLIRSSKMIKAAGLMIFEPPLVDQKTYNMIPKLVNQFEKIYLYNPPEDDNKFGKIYFPIPFNKVIDEYWCNDERSENLVIISGNHAPFFKSNELYSKRIDFVNYFSKKNKVDLYGRNWNMHFNRRILWWKYLLNYQSIMSCFRGSILNKYEALSRHKYCICFENSVINGYITEKIFDCFYAGTVPIYYGAPDVNEYINQKAFINFNDFSSIEDLEKYIENLTDSDYEEYKKWGKYFIENESSKFYDFLDYEMLGLA
jgi:hypothetical protein